jgi:hypothetical protein
MTKEEIENIKLKRKWPLKLSDFYNHYFFIIFPLAISYIGYIETKTGFKNNTENLKFSGLVILTIGILLTLFIMKRLYQNSIFESYQIEKLDNSRVEEALKKTNLKDIKFYKSGYFIAKTKISAFSWGEEITIIVDEGQLLINSKPNSFQPITILKDRENIKKVVEYLTVR